MGCVVWQELRLLVDVTKARMDDVAEFQRIGESHD